MKKHELVKYDPWVPGSMKLVGAYSSLAEAKRELAKKRARYKKSRQRYAVI